MRGEVVLRHFTQRRTEPLARLGDAAAEALPLGGGGVPLLDLRIGPHRERARSDGGERHFGGDSADGAAEGDAKLPGRLKSFVTSSHSRESRGPDALNVRGERVTDTFILSYDGTPERFVEAVARQSPNTHTRVLATGQWLTIAR